MSRTLSQGKVDMSQVRGQFFRAINLSCRIGCYIKNMTAKQVNVAIDAFLV